MTISVFEFEQINESSGDPVYPAHRRRVAQALSNTYLSIGETFPTRGVLVSNDDGTTGARIRIGTASLTCSYGGRSTQPRPSSRTFAP